MPKAYVKSVLSHIGCQVGAAGSMPFMSTPYLGHAIVQYFVDRVGTWQMWFWYNKSELSSGWLEWRLSTDQQC